MKLTRNTARLGLVALAAAFSPLAMAQSAGWYVGGNIGQSRALIDDARITSSMLSSGLTVTTIEDKKRDTGFKLLGGYQFNRNFALEGGYFNLGKMGYTATTTPAGSLTGEMKVQGLNLDLVGTLPFTEKFSGLGRVGMTYADTQDSFSRTGAVTVSDPSPNKRDSNYKFGVGLQYALTQALALRLEAERYRINDGVGNKGDVDLVSVGLVYRFGGKEQKPSPVAPVAQVAPAAPVAAVAVAPVAQTVVITRIAIAVDSDFDFDKENLNAGGMKVLDDFVKDLRGMKYEHITVRGNADRIGTEAYNMKLSVRRAETVRDYLIITGGVAAIKLDTSGVGESQPDTKAQQCDNMKDRKALVNCLQPDRRVDVEVHGTRQARN